MRLRARCGSIANSVRPAVPGLIRNAGVILMRLPRKVTRSLISFACFQINTDEACFVARERERDTGGEQLEQSVSSSDNSFRISFVTEVQFLRRFISNCQ